MWKAKLSPAVPAPPFEVPIAIVLFNRPDHVTRLVDSLRPLRPKRLLLIADGPRADRPGEDERCEQARRAVLSGIDWPAEIQTNFSDRNLGCRRRVSSGLDWVFSLVPEAIILEDDLAPAVGFFAYCAELLERYRDDPRVGAISGNCFQPADFTRPASYYFSAYPHCWGWATWRRAWQEYDHDLAHWPTAKASNALSSWFQSEAEAQYWGKLLDKVIDGTLDSWATVWTFSVSLSGMLTALPTQNLVSNLGFDELGTHTVNRKSRLAALPTGNLPSPLLHPSEIERDLAADEYTRRKIFQIADP